MSLFAPRADFTDQDSFLFAALGLLSCAAQIRQTLSALPPVAEDAEPVAVPEREDGTLLALLGVIAMAEKVSGSIVDWGSQDESLQETEPAVDGFEAIDDLLR